MKNLRGIIVTAVFCALTGLLALAAQHFDVLMDMAYPFFSKTVVEMVCGWTAGLDICLWQVIIAVYLVAVVASLALAILLRWNLLRWLGGVLAPAAVAVFLFMAVWGLNYYSKPIGEAMKLEVTDYTISDLKEAALYYRQQADQLSGQVARDENGDLTLGTLDEMNQTLSASYDNLVWRYSIFAGPHGPVKELGWADVFSEMGTDGVTIGLTGEAAVNMNQYAAAIPFTMCHETAHLLAFAREDEANFAAYLACEHSDDMTFRYSGYLKAFLYCANALYDTSKTTWKEAWDGVSDELRHDVNAINAYYDAWSGETSQQVSNVYDTYLKTMGQTSGTVSYNEVTDLLVAWYIDQYRPVEEVDLNPFDPTDYDWVFPAETGDTTEPTQEG